MPDCLKPSDNSEISTNQLSAARLTKFQSDTEPTAAGCLNYVERSGSAIKIDVPMVTKKKKSTIAARLKIVVKEANTGYSQNRCKANRFEREIGEGNPAVHISFADHSSIKNRNSAYLPN